jgi:hypothetical protein
MSKRLQVVLDDGEFADFQRAADEQGVTLSGWVRQSLRFVRRRSASGDMESRLAAVRGATGHSFPTADIDAMLGEIEQGYHSA